MKRICLALLVLAVSASAAVAQWNLKEKDQFYAEFAASGKMQIQENGATREIHENTRIYSRITVLKANLDGSRVIEFKLERIQQEMSNGQTDLLIGMLEGAVLEVTLDHRLQIVRLEGLEPVVAMVIGKGGSANEKLLRETLHDHCRSFLDDIFVPVPERPVSGQSWEQQCRLPMPGFGHMRQTRKFVWQGPHKTGDLAEFTCTTDYALDLAHEDVVGAPVRNTSVELKKGDYQAEFLFDQKAGRLHSSVGKRTMALKVSWVQAGVPIEHHTSSVRTVALRIHDRNPLSSAGSPTPATPVDVNKLPKEITNSVGMKLVLIPSGKFTMGSPVIEAGRFPDEEEHVIEITRPFHMGAHEVTIGQFRQFVEESHYQTASEKSVLGCCGFNEATAKIEGGTKYSWKNPGWKVTDQHPVVNLSWHDAKAYCAWLSRKEGKLYRLPTEAEWEYSCRAGSKTRYAHGDDPERLISHGNVVDASAKKLFPQWTALAGDDGHVFTAPVGQFAANAFGLFDMHGNANEWCEDWYWRYNCDAGQDPVGPPAGTRRVLRSGSWADFPLQCTAAHRGYLEPDNWTFASGFRVVLDCVAPAIAKAETAAAVSAAPPTPSARAETAPAVSAPPPPTESGGPLVMTPPPIDLTSMKPVDPKAPLYNRVLTGRQAYEAEDLAHTQAALFTQNKVDEALDCARKLLELRTRWQGADHWETCNAQLHVKMLERLQALSPQGRSDLEETAKILRPAFGLAQAGKAEEALEQLEKGLSHYRAVIGDDFPLAAKLYLDLAKLVQKQNPMAQNQNIYQKAVDFCRRRLGDENPDTVLFYNNLGSRYLELEQYVEAEKPLRAAANLSRAVHGEENAEHTAKIYDNLASSLTNQGKSAEAQGLSEKALAIFRKVLGEDHPDTVVCAYNLSLTLLRLQNYGEAEVLLRKTQASQQKRLGPDDPQTVLNYNNLAAALIGQGRDAEAEPLMRQSLVSRQRTLGAQHPLTLESCHYLGHLLRRLGKNQEAEELLRRSNNPSPAVSQGPK